MPPQLTTITSETERDAAKLRPDLSMVTGPFRRYWRTLCNWRARSQVSLHELSDRGLTDIGLTRGEVESLAPERVIDRLRDETRALWARGGMCQPSAKEEREAIMTSCADRDRAAVNIRRLSVDDLDRFRDIRAEALRTHPQTFYSPEEDGAGEAMLAAYRHWLNGMLLGAFNRGHLIGVAGFYVSPDRRSQHRGNIYTVYVRENHRAIGVGDQLIKQLLSHAATCVEQVHLAVLVEASAAVRTYQRNGFEIYGTDPAAVRIGDATYDKYLMVRRFSH